TQRDSYIDIPNTADMVELANKYRAEMIEAAVELDDAAMATFFEGKEPDEATLKRLIRKAVITSAFFPVLAGAAFKNKGVQTLLDAVLDYLPSPLDVPAMHGVDLKGNEVVRHASDSEPLAMLAFKIMDDPFVGSLTFCRVYSGTITAGQALLNSPPKTPRSASRPTRRAARPSSRGWASSTSTSRSTSSSGPTRSTSTRASRRSPTARPSRGRSTTPTPTRSRPAARASSRRSP